MAESSHSEQVPFGTDSFADNPEPRCPCLLLLDISGSMAGAPISELNAGLVTFKDELAADSLAMKRVEVAVVTFGPVKVESSFHTAPNFFPPHLQASGDTPMGAAIKQGLDMIKQRKEEYRAKVFRSIGHIDIGNRDKLGCRHSAAHLSSCRSQGAHPTGLRLHPLGGRSRHQGCRFLPGWRRGDSN